jgi:hypothetical protein
MSLMSEAERSAMSFSPGRSGVVTMAQSTQRLACVIQMLSRRMAYRSLTPVAKAKWTMSLANNENDCRGMRALMLLATSELESD